MFMRLRSTFFATATFALLLAAMPRAQGTDIIQTVVGGGSLDGYAPDQANLSLGATLGLTLSPTGDLYFSDTNHNQVLKIVPTSGKVAVVAGNGSRAFNGDGLPATSAGLNGPGALAFDKTGNLLIVDRGNFVIRRVDALSGVISTIAGVGLFTGQVVGTNPPAPLGDGGAALAASFGNMGGLIVDSTGAVIVCDSGNACVRKFTVGGNIATIAGTPGSNGFTGDAVVGGALTATFNSPSGIAIDSAGAIYIADSNNRRVRRLATDNTVSTVVGSGGGANAFTGDGGLATSAQLGSVGGLAFDAAGNLVIACIGSNHVRKSNVKDLGAIILTVAGNGGADVLGDGGPATGAALAAPRDVAVDAAGNIFIYDANHGRIRRVDAATSFIDTVAGTGLEGFVGDRAPKQFAILSGPGGSTFDATGNLYVADSGFNAVRKVALDGTVSTFAGSGTANGLGDGGTAALASLSNPSDVLVVGTNLLIADTGHDAIRKVDLTTNLISTFTTINSPTAIVADSAGVLYVAHDNVIETVDATGAVTAFAGQTPMDTVANPLGDGLPAANATLSSPQGLALSAAGELYIADRGNNRIRKIGAAPGLVTSTFAGGGMQTAPAIGDGGAATAAVLNAPAGVAVDGTRVLISDSDNNRLRSVALGTNVITTISGTGTAGFLGDGSTAVDAQVNAPGRMYFRNGNVIFADTDNNRIRTIVTATDLDPKLLALAAKLTFSIDKKTGNTIVGKDSLALKASLQLPAGITAANLSIQVDVVDVHQQITLDAAGKQPKVVKPAKKAAVVDPFVLTLPTVPPAPITKIAFSLKGTSVAGAKPVPFSFKSTGTFRDTLGRAGYTDVTTAKEGVSLPVRVNITIGTTTFTGLTTTLYKATQDKSGSAASVKIK